MEKICPFMSNEKNKVPCIGEDCKFWIKVGHREGRECALVTVADGLNTIRYVG